METIDINVKLSAIVKNYLVLDDDVLARVVDKLVELGVEGKEDFKFVTEAHLKDILPVVKAKKLLHFIVASGTLVKIIPWLSKYKFNFIMSCSRRRG